MTSNHDNTSITPEESEQRKNYQNLHEQVKTKLVERSTIADKLEQVMSVFNNQGWSNTTQNNLKDASQRIMDAINSSSEKIQSLLHTLSQLDNP